MVSSSQSATWDSDSDDKRRGMQADTRSTHPNICPSPHGCRSHPSGFPLRANHPWCLHTPPLPAAGKDSFLSHGCSINNRKVIPSFWSRIWVNLTEPSWTFHTASKASKTTGPGSWCLADHKPGVHAWFQPVFVDAAGPVEVLGGLGPGHIEAPVELQDPASAHTANVRIRKDTPLPNPTKQIMKPSMSPSYTSNHAAKSATVRDFLHRQLATEKSTRIQ